MGNTDIGKATLNLLQSKGAEKAQCVITVSRKDEFNIESGRLSLLRTAFDRSLSITAFVDNRKGSIVISSLDPEAVSAACAECVKSACSGVADEAYDIAPAVERMTFVQQSEELNIDKLYFRVTEFIDSVKEEFPLIVLEQAVCDFKIIESVYQNTNGAHYTVRNGYYELRAVFSANDGTNCTSFNYQGVVCADLSKPFLDCGALRNTLKATVEQLHSKPLTGKFIGTVLMPSVCLYDFIYMLKDTFTSDRVIIDGTSPWRNKLGKCVTDKRLSIEVAPRNKDIVCGERVTSYGFLSDDYYLIKDGVLQSFALSFYGSNKTGFARAKNSSNNYIVHGGDTPIAEMVSNIEHGIIIGRFSGGEPAANGDFSGIAKNGFLIEKGKICHPISETMIAGNLLEMFNSIRSISDEVDCYGAMSLPSIAFDGITISGR